MEGESRDRCNDQAAASVRGSDSGARIRAAQFAGRSLYGGTTASSPRQTRPAGLEKNLAKWFVQTQVERFCGPGWNGSGLEKKVEQAEKVASVCECGSSVALVHKEK